MKKLLLTGVLLGCALPLRAQVVISEFMADNAESVRDDSGSYEDWIEVHNPGAAAMDLEGWSLTDDATDLKKWTFPAGVTLPPHGHMVVWASSKNRRTAGSPLHTNFKLSAEGDYLALVSPAGVKATEFAPAYPPQLTGVSYGPAAQATVVTAIQEGAAGKVLVPQDSAPGITWTAPGFNDSAWTNATNGIGFETGANEYGTAAPGNLQDGPVAWYRLEETGLAGIPAINATTGGPSGLYLNGVTQNVATLQSPAFPGFDAANTGARFNGTTQKIDVPWTAALNSPSFSFSLWMKWNGSNATTNKAMLTSRESTPQRGFITYILPTSRRLSFWTGTGTAWSAMDAPADTGAVTANTWYHVAGTYDGISKTKTLYLNGVSVVTATVPVYAPNTQYPLRIGAGGSENAGQFFFPGDLDEVAMFDRALSAEEIAAQYAAATTGADAPAVVTTQTPAGYWRLSDPDTAHTVTAVNAGTAGTAANGLYTSSPLPGVNGPRPPAEAGMPADNRALRANATGYVETPYLPELNPEVFSVECWARVTGGSGTSRAVISSRNDDGAATSGYTLYAGTNNAWQFWTGTGGTGAWDTLTGPAVSMNNWVHLVATFDGTTKRLFVNGTQAGTGTQPPFLRNTARPLRIGAGANEAAANFLFAGDIDEVAIYSRALTPGEITRRFQHGKTNTAPPPLTDFAGLTSTDLKTQMHGVNASAYLRLPFTVADRTAIDGLVLKMKYDDGFQAYLNGVPVAWSNVPEGALTWNAAATQRSSNAEAVVFESFSLNSGLSALQNGQNVLAIHGLNLSASNPDFLQVARLEMTDAGAYSPGPLYLTSPTPGELNTTGAANPGPALSLESFSPAPAVPGTDLVVTCRVQAVFLPVASVTLNWRTGYTPVQQLPMKDDGTGGDLQAGDGIYSATIPATGFAAGNMVRWYFTAADTGTGTTRWPVFSSRDNSPEYFGTMIAAANVNTTLPVWYWFAQSTAAASTRSGTRCSVFLNGEFYDNVFVRQRGGATSTGSRKFDFNTGFHALINEETGRVEEANLNGTSLSSGLGGDSADATLIRPALAYEVFRTSGHPGGHAFPVMMRVNGASDTAGGRGGIAYFVEQVDERYLRRNNLDEEGALYKMDQRSNLNPVFYDATDGVEKKTRVTENNADLQAVVNGLRSPADGYNYASSGPNPAAPNPPEGFLNSRRLYMFDNFDLANMVNYLACRAIIGDSDDTRKNFYMYRDTNDTREWLILPWDKDGTFGIQLDDTHYQHPFKGDYVRRKSPGANQNNQWSYLWEALYNEPATRDMYLRRLRTLMDTILQPAPGGYLQGRADFWWAGVAPHKPAANTTGIKAWLSTRRTQLFTTYSNPNSLGTGLQIPPAQSADAAIAFGAADYNPASGNQEEEYVELTNNNAAAVDISGWELRGGIEHTFTAGTVILPGGKLFAAGRSWAFRHRSAAPTGGQGLFVQGNYNGTLSARGETIQLWDPKNPATPEDDRLVASLNTPANPTPAQQALRITELMYDPPAGGSYAAGEYEYVELMNTGTTPLSLTGAMFDEGITFTFGNTTVQPGARILIVKNQAAFESRYGPALPVAGVYTGSLDNSGERLRIVDAMGEEVLDFRYEATWYPATHGDASLPLGASLVIEDPFAPWNTWERQSSWRASSAASGSPGTADPLPPVPALVATGAGSVEVRGGIPGRSYELQRSADLGTWTPLLYGTAAAGGTLTLTDPEPLPGRAFYRVRAK